MRTVESYKVVENKVQAHALSRCSHCLWKTSTSNFLIAHRLLITGLSSCTIKMLTLSLVSARKRNSPTSIRTRSLWPPWHAWCRAPRPSCKFGTQTMTQWTVRDRELVNSSLHPPHSGPLHLLWAVHGQSFDGPLYKPAGSSPGLPGGRLADMALPCAETQATHNKFAGW